MSETSPPALVVRTDRRAVDRLFRRVVAVQGTALVVLVGCLAVVVALTDLAALAVPFGLVLLLTVLQIAIQSYTWGARAAVDAPLVVSAEGLVFTTARGVVRLAWPVVASLSERRVLGRPILRVHVVADLTPDGPGVESDLSATQWSRLVRQGIPLGSVGITPGLDVVEQAVAHFSGGRLLVPGHWGPPT